jgi:predicted DNA-binding protein
MEEEDVKMQFKMRLAPQLVERLDRLAAKCGYTSAQQFVIVGLDGYAELLAELILEQQDQAELLRKRQREQLLSKGGQVQGSGTSRRK